jgi:hypothetical protein
VIEGELGNCSRCTACHIGDGRQDGGGFAAAVVRVVLEKPVDLPVG